MIIIYKQSTFIVISGKAAGPNWQIFWKLIGNLEISKAKKIEFVSKIDFFLLLKISLATPGTLASESYSQTETCK